MKMRNGISKKIFASIVFLFLVISVIPFKYANSQGPLPGYAEAYIESNKPASSAAYPEEWLNIHAPERTGGISPTTGEEIRLRRVDVGGTFDPETSYYVETYSGLAGAGKYFDVDSPLRYKLDYKMNNVYVPPTSLILYAGTILDKITGKVVNSAKIESAYNPELASVLDKNTIPADVTAKLTAYSDKKAFEQTTGSPLGELTKVSGSTNKYTSSNPAYKGWEFQLDTSSDLKEIKIVGTIDPTGKKTTYAVVSIVCHSSWNPAQIDYTCLFANFSYFIVFDLASKLLEISGKVFDYSIKATVLNMSQNLGLGSDSNDSSVIYESWRLFRDIANILFVFTLIYISIKTILKGTGDTGKQIGTVIIVAVLINFSMLFTKIFIDFTNIIALNFYDNISTTSISKQKNTIADRTKGTISEKFVEASRIGTTISIKDTNDVLAKSANITQKEAAHLNHVSIIKQALSAAALFAILGSIFLLISFMLLSRFIILMVVLITSSLAFGSYIIPKLKTSISDKWISALIGQSLFPAVFLLFIYISIKIIGTVGFNITSKGTFGGDLTTAQPEVFMGFFLVAGLLIMSVKVSKSLADMAGTGSSTLTKFIGGAALGAVAWGGRMTLGAAGKGVAKVTGDSDTLVARGFRAAGQGLANRSYNLRELKTFQGVANQTGVDVGKGGGEGGFEKGFTTWRESEGIINGSALAHLIVPNKKLTEKEEKKHEENYKKAGEYTNEEREIVTAHDLREKLNKQRDSVDIKLEEAKKKGDTNLAAILTKQLKSLNKNIIDHTVKYGSEITLKAQKQTIDERVSTSQSDFLTSRQSNAGVSFARKQLAKNAKEETDLDKLLKGITAASSANTPPPPKPSTPSTP